MRIELEKTLEAKVGGYIGRGVLSARVDEEGHLLLKMSDGQEINVGVVAVKVDATLSKSGRAADAKATGEAVSGVQQTANEACMVADDAYSVAQTAQEKAQTAQSAAEAAGQRAEDAQQTADDAAQRAEEAYRLASEMLGTSGADGKSAYAIAQEQGFEGSETEWLESLKGEKGDKGEKGETGAAGSQGIQGMQGEPGTEGKSAYQSWLDLGNTGTQEQFIAALHASQPVFVTSEAEMTEPGKVYVYKGYIYAYGWKEGTGMTPTFSQNFADPGSSDWKVDTRINSSGNFVDAEGTHITNPFPVKQGDYIHVKGASLGSSASGVNSRFFNAAGGKITDFSSYNGWIYGTINAADYDESVLVWGPIGQKQNNVGEYESWAANIASMLLGLNPTGDAADVVVTVNEPITYTVNEGGYQWINTGVSYAPADYEARIISLETEAADHARRIADMEAIRSQNSTNTAPEYWLEHLAEKTKTVKALQESGGKDAVSFVWVSDTHIPDNNGGRTNDIGKAMAYVMDACNIPFAVLSGDIYSQGSAASKEILETYMEQVPVHLAPLWGSDRLLAITGNHDGCYGADPVDGETDYYRRQLSPQEMWNRYFRGQATDFRRVFSDDGSYYYVDNTTQKTRFIMLNSNWHGEYATDENGLAVPNRFDTSCYGQAQLDWLKDVALDMADDDWSAIIITHVPPITADYAVDYIPFRGIIDDFANKKAGSWSYTDGVDGWSNCSVSTDFTNAKGQIIAVLSGHIHQDNYFADITWSHIVKVPLITVTTAGGDVRDENTPARTDNTATETAFDVVTIDRKTRKIYCTRIGAGFDRGFNY